MNRLGIFLIAVVGFSSAAHASSHCATLVGDAPDCACALSLDEFDPASTAILIDIVGTVDVTNGDQYSPADPSIPLNIGDGVLVFEDSSALLNFGPTCWRQLPEQSSLVIREKEGCACASLVEAQTQAAAGGTSNGGAMFLGALGTGAIGGGVYYLTTLEDDEPSPVTPD